MKIVKYLCKLCGQHFELPEGTEPVCPICGATGDNVVKVEDLLAESIDRVEKIIEEKNPSLENKEEVAKMVGVGAIIFNDLANNRIKDEIFDWKQILNFAGETGPCGPDTEMFYWRSNQREI